MVSGVVSDVDAIFEPDYSGGGESHHLTFEMLGIPDIRRLLYCGRHGDAVSQISCVTRL